MPDEVAIEMGEGPGIVLLHGVGAGPDTFRTLACHLALDHHVLVVERPWRPDAPPTLADQADEVHALLDDRDLAEATVVGVSGGGTLALVLALRHPERPSAMVAHEPLVGRHAAGLHRTFSVAAQHAARDDTSAIEVVRSVMGEQTWRNLGPAERSEVIAGAARARAEIPTFAAFNPSEDDLRSLKRTTLLITVGATSHPDRRTAAGVLSRLAGTEVVVVPGSGNAVQLDAPAAFAHVVRTWIASTPKVETR